MPFIPIIIIILVVVLILVLATNLKVVQQSKAYVIERLGAFHSVWGVGIHFKVPFLERVAKVVSLKEQVVDFPPQPVITKDNVPCRSTRFSTSRSPTLSSTPTGWSGPCPPLRT